MKEGKFFSTKEIVELAMFSAIIFAIGMTPMGYIPIGTMNIITVHIPVIIASILLGPKKGAFLGFVLGLTSFITAHIQASPMAYFFSPFFSSNLLSLVVCFVPRILVGVVPYFVYKGLIKLNSKLTNVALVVSGLSGSLVNTILVMSFIYIFFGKEYAQVLGEPFEKLFKIIIITILPNALIEAFAASFITLFGCKILLKINNKRVN